jgi:hypothetical protein
MQTEGRARSRVWFWNENTTMFLVFSLHRTWKLWMWLRSIAPVNRQENPKDNLEFHFTQFNKVCTLICICFHVKVWYCMNVLNMTGNEGCILHVGDMWRSCTLQYMVFLQICLYFNWIISKQNIYLWTMEHSNQIAERSSCGGKVCVLVALSCHVIIKTVGFDDT